MGCATTSDVTSEVTLTTDDTGKGQTHLVDEVRCIVDTPTQGLEMEVISCNDPSFAFNSCNITKFS